MSAAWAVPGAKCVCVLEPTPASRERFPEAKWPVLKGIYTIRAVLLVTAGKGKGDPCILLEEIVNPIIEGLGSHEPGMPTYAFRPLITKTQEQDVALFQHILDGLPVRERA